LHFLLHLPGSPATISRQSGTQAGGFAPQPFGRFALQRMNPVFFIYTYRQTDYKLEISFIFALIFFLESNFWSFRQFFPFAGCAMARYSTSQLPPLDDYPSMDVIPSSSHPDFKMGAGSSCTGFPSPSQFTYARAPLNVHQLPSMLPFSSEVLLLVIIVV